MKTRTLHHATLTALMALGATALTSQALAQASAPKLDRTSLPIKEPDYPHSTVLDARNAKAPPRFEVKPPAGAPNVLIVLVDDMGFGMPSTFGGPVRMPAADRLASQGLRYNQFHDRQGHRVDEVSESTHAGQTILHLLRARCHARAASCAEGMD